MKAFFPSPQQSAVVRGHAGNNKDTLAVPDAENIPAGKTKT